MKYQGSKNRIAKDIIPIMLNGMNYGDYFIDAFCGGCNLLDKVPNSFNRIANDNNEYLVAMFMYLTSGWEPITHIDRETYNLARDCYNRKCCELFHKHELGWIGFMASVNGRFFCGGYSGHCVKIGNGNTRDYISESIRNIMPQIPLLKDVIFRCGNYDEIELPPANRTTIYCDIPYNGVKQYTTSKDFDYEKFYDWCREKHSEGYRIFVSEYQMPDDFKCVWQKQITCSMNQTITKKPIEKLFTL